MPTSIVTARQLRLTLCSLVAVGTLLTVAMPAAAQAAKTPEQEIEALVMEFTRYEDSGDMMAQSRLIAPDRWWHGIGGRRTDNALWMKVQQEGFEASQKRYPGVRYMREVRDLRIRMVAPTVAVSSFVWFVNRVIPPDLPADKVQALGLVAVPLSNSLVWVRQADGWKIVNSHNSPLYLR